jgi:lipopolysaccharide export LptBFGC system permease protein LptF
MNFERLLNTGINFLQSHPIAVIILVVSLVIFSTAKPKDIYKFLVFAVIMGVILYIISQFGETASIGLQQKNEMIHQTQKKGF